MPKQRPTVIAHRGASGYLPEHTLEAYSLAIGLGADFVEPDLVLTRDKRFVCLHDIYLEITTNVEQVFPKRHRDDGRWYAADFTLAEIKSLNAHERLPNRFPQDRGSFAVPTFEEMLELVAGLNKTLGRNVGVYPELKAPAWHRAEGLPMEAAFLSITTAFGYSGKGAPIYVQCFEADSLREMRRSGSLLPQVMLLEDDPNDPDRLTADGLAKIAEFANAIGPAKTLIEADPALVERAHAAGLLVHPWTFRADMLPPTYATFEDELHHFLAEVGVDGLFSDFPDRVRHAVDQLP